MSANNIPVTTPDGEVPIADLAIGDLVWAWNETSTTTGVYTITATIHHTDPVVVLLAIGDETLETTPEHPFYTLERGWVNAEELRVGERVPQIDGEIGAVRQMTVVARTQPMYNLTVAIAHTFFVGDAQWLVHNACGRSGRQNQLKALADDPKVSSADRGWIKQEINAIERGNRNSIRNPSGRVLAHRRGFEARKGFDYTYSDLQDTDLHRLQHKYEGYK